MSNNCIADSNGIVQKELWNEETKHKHVKYYYQNADECKFKFKDEKCYFLVVLLFIFAICLFLYFFIHFILLFNLFFFFNFLFIY